jgi:hypothetical protein
MLEVRGFPGQKREKMVFFDAKNGILWLKMGQK